MVSTRKPKKVKGYNVNIELRKAEHLFKSIAKDKNLPSFGCFFMECLILGTAENVNLKVMYPDVYERLYSWLKEHREQILAIRK